MMVDDEPMVIETLENFLEDTGYKNFVTTTDSTEVLDLLAAKQPDIVLLDVMMPDVSGLDILESMGKDESLKYIPAIIITAATDAETKMKALELGATEVLNKPVDSSELALRVRNTLATKANQDRLMKFDELTGLPNSRLFRIRLADALTRAREESSGLAVLHLDLDHYKRINDTLGISIGDGLLKAVARRLEKWLRDTDIAAISGVHLEDMALSRYNSDEFMLILHNVLRVENAAQLAGDMLSTLEKPFRVGGREIYVTGSIGIATFPTEELSAECASDSELMNALLRHAGVAVSDAKERGRNTVRHYSAELSAKSTERITLEAELRRALDRHELSLAFKPKANVWSNGITGAEAVLCWQSPKLGSVAPGKFLPLAEETGLIVPFTEWMIYAVCALNEKWRSSGIEPLPVSVGVATRQFDLTRLMMAIRTSLEQTGLPAGCLSLELTESVFVESPEENARILGDIKRMGVGLSLGRFGTGYSSLQLLRKFPFEQLKIDPSFMEGVPENADNAAIASSFIAMANRLGLAVVADGVDNAEQLEYVKDRGCDEYQGTMLSAAVPAAEFLSLLAKNVGKS